VAENNRAGRKDLSGPPSSSAPPKVLEPVGRHFGVPDGVLDVLVAEPCLQRPRIVPGFGVASLSGHAGFPRADHVAFPFRGAYVSAVSRRISPKKLLRPAKLRSWRVSIIRKRGQYLGTVEAPNEKAAEAAAVAEFDLSDEQRRRLVVSEHTNQARRDLA